MRRKYFQPMDLAKNRYPEIEKHSQNSKKKEKQPNRKTYKNMNTGTSQRRNTQWPRYIRDPTWLIIWALSVVSDVFFGDTPRPQNSCD